MPKAPIEIRGPLEGDYNLIKKSAIGSTKKEWVPFGVFTEAMNTVFHGLFFDPDVTKVVAVNPSDPNQIYGWAMTDHLGDVPILHYVYVKDAFRRLGIAEELLKAGGIQLDRAFFYTIKGFFAPTLTRKFPFAAFNPYLLFEPIYSAEANEEYRDE